jgi:hypothetical protein
VPPHYALEATAFGCASNINYLASREHISLENIPNRMIFDIVSIELTKVANKATSSSQMTLLRLRQTLRRGIAEADLYGLIAIALLCSDLSDHTRADL